MARLTTIRNFIIGLLMGVVLVVAASGAILLISHEGRTAVKTAMLVPELFPDASVRVLERFSTAPLVEQVSFPYSGGVGAATLVRPQDTARHGAAILFLGVNPDLDDATLRRLSEAMAREGVVVLLPKPVRLTQGEVSHQEVDLLVGAFRYLQRATFVDPERIGFGGFCVGSSLALLAASDPRISEQVRFVNSFGGYFSVESLLGAMTTGQAPIDGEYAPWEPNPDARLWFLQQLLIALSPADREILGDAAKGGPSFVSLTATDLPSLQLSPEGRSIVQLAINRDLDRVAELYAALPLSVQAKFERLSPGTSLAWLGPDAKVFVMHDRHDTYVPVSESQALVAALEEHPRKYYTEFELFKHMHPDPTSGVEPAELLKLFYHLYLVMLEIA